MLDKDFNTFSELEAALDKVAKDEVNSIESQLYHTSHLWDYDRLAEYISKEMEEFSQENFNYHLLMYKSSDRDDRNISRVILIYYRDMYLSNFQKAQLPIELLWAKT